MTSESSSKHTKKEDTKIFKSLLPGILFGTLIVVTIGLLGRKATKT